MPMPPVPQIAAPSAPSALPATGLSEALACQFCGERFEQVKPLSANAKWLKRGKDRFPPTPVVAHADHEMKCKENPDRPERGKASTAWVPQPFPVGRFGGAQPSPTATRVTYLGGPYHGRSQGFECFLVDGTRVAVQPPLVAPGPQQEDSKGRVCSRYMGHYELRLKGGCPIYRWVDTIVPKKKRLGETQTLEDLWPEWAAQLMEEPNDEPTAVDDGGDPVADESDPGLPGDLLDSEPGAEPE